MSIRTLFLVAAVTASAPAQFLVYEPTTPVPGLGDATDQLAVGDVDGDGLDDLVVAGFDVSPLRVALSNGDGTFAPPTSLGPDQTRPFALFDTDADGVLDLVHGTAPPQTVAVSRGLGDGTFAAPVSIVPAPSIPSTAVSAISTGDVDGDGVVDFAIEQGYAFSSDRRVFLGGGDGTFSEAADLPSGLFISTVALGDVDGDGLDDLVVDGTSGPSWRRSLGDGSFADAEPAVEGAVIDVLASPTAEFGRVEAGDVVLRALVDDAFVEVARFTLPFGKQSGALSVADVDDDGRPDLIVFGAGVGHVFLQAADGSFALASSFTVVSDFNARPVVVEDAEGRRDLAFASFFGGVTTAADATYAADAPFTDLGGNTPGSAGFPTQVFDADDDTLSVRVLSAAPSSPVYAVWGGSIGAPLGPSATSPSPDRVLGPFTTTPLGTLEVSAGDALPLGLDVYAQWWVVDPIDGLASTSTVVIDG